MGVPVAGRSADGDSSVELVSVTAPIGKAVLSIPVMGKAHDDDGPRQTRR